MGRWKTLRRLRKTGVVSIFLRLLVAAVLFYSYLLLINNRKYQIIKKCSKEIKYASCHNESINFHSMKSFPINFYCNKIVKDRNCDQKKIFFCFFKLQMFARKHFELIKAERKAMATLVQLKLAPSFSTASFLSQTSNANWKLL